MNVLRAGLVSRLKALTDWSTRFSRTVTPYVGDCLEVKEELVDRTSDNVTYGSNESSSIRMYIKWQPTNQIIPTYDDAVVIQLALSAAVMAPLFGKPKYLMQSSA